MVALGFFILHVLPFEVFNNKEMWEMVGDRSGFVTGGAFIQVSVDKYVVKKCFCSTCYSSRKCYLWYKVM